LKEDILPLLLQTEEDYRAAVKDAVREAEEYVENRRKKQAVYIEELKHDFEHFKANEAEKLERDLSAESEKMEIQADGLKQRMKVRQQEKADRMSELLKEEVLSLLWR